MDRIAQKYSINFKKPFFKKYLYGRGQLHGKEFIIVKPLTYMNNSGFVIPGLLKKFRIPSEKMVVICDNMDLPYGMCRIKKKGSGGGHNGLRSIDSFMEGRDYTRLFVGVSRPDRSVSIIDHVLSVPDGSDFRDFMNGVDRASGAVETIVDKSVEEAMHEYNRRIT